MYNGNSKLPSSVTAGFEIAWVDKCVHYLGCPVGGESSGPHQSDLLWFSLLPVFMVSSLGLVLFILCQRKLLRA